MCDSFVIYLVSFSPCCKTILHPMIKLIDLINQLMLRNIFKVLISFINDLKQALNTIYQINSIKGSAFIPILMFLKDP